MAISKRFIEGVIGGGIGAATGGTVAASMYKPRTPRTVVDSYGRQVKRPLTPREKSNRKKLGTSGAIIGGAITAAALPFAVKKRLKTFAATEPKAFQSKVDDLLGKFRAENQKYKTMSSGASANSRLDRIGKKRSSILEGAITKLEDLKKPEVSKALNESRIYKRQRTLFGGGKTSDRIIANHLGIRDKKVKDVFESFLTKIEAENPVRGYV